MKLRRDHIVPRFYLEGFSSLPPGRRNPCLHVFDRKQEKHYTQTPDEAWRVANYYDVVGKDGQPTDALDQVNQKIEGACAPLFKAGGFLLEQRWPTDAERTLLAWFAGMLAARGLDDHHRFAETMKEVATTGLLLSQHHCKDEPEDFERAVRSIEKQIGVKIAGATLGDVASAAIDPDLDGIKAEFFSTMSVPATQIRGMPWTILVAQGEDVFVTSDRPLMRESMGFGGTDGLLGNLTQEGFHYVLPLTSKFALGTHLELEGKDRGFIPATTHEVIAINGATWTRAPRYRYASREDFTGLDPILARDERNQFLQELFDSLSRDAQRVVNVIFDGFPPATVEDAERLANVAEKDLRVVHWREDVEEAITFLDHLIANRHRLSPSWAGPLNWFRQWLAEFATTIDARGSEHESG